MINRNRLVVNSWVGVHAGCEITYRIHEDEGVYVTLNGDSEPFEFFIDIEALRDFLAKGTTALAELDATT